MLSFFLLEVPERPLYRCLLPEYPVFLLGFPFLPLFMSKVPKSLMVRVMTNQRFPKMEEMDNYRNFKYSTIDPTQLIIEYFIWHISVFYYVKQKVSRSHMARRVSAESLRKCKSDLLYFSSSNDTKFNRLVQCFCHGPSRLGFLGIFRLFLYPMIQNGYWTLPALVCPDSDLVAA